jgi:hypothetical protein
METQEITFEMAQELGLIPSLESGYPGLYPFESRYGAEKRQENEERSYRLNLARVKEKFAYVNVRGEKLKVV